MTESPAGRRQLPAETLDLATRALNAALHGDTGAAIAAIDELTDQHQGIGLADALMVWCDTYGMHITGGRIARERPAHVTSVGLINPANGSVARPGDPRLDPIGSWVGRTIRARLTMDRAAWIEVMTELVETAGRDSGTAGSMVLSLLRSIAATINGLPRGCAVTRIRPCPTCGSKDVMFTGDRVLLCNGCGSTHSMDVLGGAR